MSSSDENASFDGDVVLLSYESSEAPERDLSEFRGLFPSLFIQSFDPDCAVGEEHVRLLLAQTIYASEKGQLLARKKEIDFLMRLAITDQIKKAIKIAGAKPKQKAAVVVYGKDCKKAEQMMMRSGFTEVVELKKKSDPFLLVGKAALLGAKRRKLTSSHP